MFKEKNVANNKERVTFESTITKEPYIKKHVTQQTQLTFILPNYCLF